MKRTVSFLLLFSLLIVSSLSVGATEDEFELDVSVTGISPAKIYTGDTVTLTVEVANVSSDSSEKLWGAVVYIDQELISASLLEHMTINEPGGAAVVYDGNDHQGTEVWPGDTVYSTLSFTLDDDAPGGVHQIPITLTGKRGPCTQGCHPWKEDTIYVSINIIRGIPAISISFSDNNIATVGDTLMINFTLKNLGSDDALSLVPSIQSEYSSLVGQINLSGGQNTLEPNKTLDGTIAIYTSSVGVGEFDIELLLDFRDRKNKEYEQKKSVTFTVNESSELTFEEMGDHCLESGLDYYDLGEYESAFVELSQAKGYYDLAGALEKSESADSYLTEAYAALSLSLTPDPVVELKDQYYLLLVGLAAGFVVTLGGLVAGMAKAKK